MPQTDPETLLKEASLRVTRPRVATLDAVQAHPHADTYTVIDAVRERSGAVSTQAIYDVLKALTSAGLLRRIELEGTTARYERRVGDNHHHAVCRGCGVIADVDCAAGAAPCLAAPDDLGFVVEEAEVTYWGTCHNCRSS